MKSKVNEIKCSYIGGIQAHCWQKIKCSKDAANIINDHWDQNTIVLQECFKIVLLNNSNKVKGIYQISQGGITGTLVDLRILFAVVLKSLSVAIILTHNHPSGTLKPSNADIQLTQQIKNAADILNIRLFDHIIITPDKKYFSFTDEGLL